MKELKIMLILETLTWITLFLLLAVVPALLGLWPLAILSGIMMTVMIVYGIDEIIDDIERGF